MKTVLPALERLLRLFAFLVIGFFFGVLFAYDNPAFKMAVTATLDVFEKFRDRYNSTWWLPARGPESGVTTYDPARAYNGLTLYISPDLLGARLIDMHGRERYRWQVDSKLIEGDGGIGDLFGEAHLFWDTAYLYPNGDLLAAIVRDWTPYGYRLIKLDRHSHLLWQLPIHAHHDISVDAEGRIYTLNQRIRETKVAGWPQIATPFLEDSVVRLSPDGQIEAEVSIIEAFARSEYARYLALHPVGERGDILHVNKADVITPAQSAKLPFAKAGQVLLSLREIHTVAVIDLDEKRIVWATRGPWLFQHDPDILDNGHLLLFDNLGNFGSGGTSRAIEYDPLTQAIVWTYAGTVEAPLSSTVRSGVQRLPNGNTLITESDGGRLIEVTAAGDVVWQFVNPARSDDGKLIGAIGLDVARFDEKALPFLAAAK